MTFKLELEKLAGKGKAFGRHNGKAVFVPFGVPGDKLELKTSKETKSFIEADIQKVLEKSSIHTEPDCHYFGSCGGCHHQNIKYEDLLKLKLDLLKEVYRKFITDDLTIKNFKGSSNIFKYRNKIHVHGFQNKKFQTWGFYHYKDKKIIDIASCSIAQAEISQTFKKVVTWFKQFYFKLFLTIKEIIIQTDPDEKKIMVTFIGTKEIEFPEVFFNELKKVLPNIQGVYFYHSRNKKGYVFKEAIKQSLTDVKGLKNIGGEFLNFKFKDIKMTLSPLSFFQVNHEVAAMISDTLETELSHYNEKPVLVDLFAGIGALSLPLASFCRKIYGVEIVHHASELAKINARENNIENYQTITGDAERKLKSIYKELKKQTSILLLDPPRQGLSSRLSEMISHSEFHEIFYLSCHPHAQVRDLERIQSAGKYRIKSIQPFDMFPQTYHNEVLVILTKTK